MKQIKFSETTYKKLPKNYIGTQAVLIEVTVIDIENQTPAFIEYDTSFEGGKYPLPTKGKFILLSFIHQSGAFFTTLRRYTEEKYDYYIGLILDEFKIVKA